MAVGIVLAIAIDAIQQKKRREFFARRPAVSLETWYQTHYANSGMSAAEVRGILEVVGEALGVQPTELKPTDLLEGEMSLFEFERSETMEFLCECLNRYIQERYGIRFSWASSWRTLDQLIRGTVKQIRHSSEQEVLQ